MSGRAQRYRHLDPEEKADLALEELDMLEAAINTAIERMTDKMDAAITELKSAHKEFSNELAGLRKTLTNILITIVTGMVVALSMWLWTNAASGPS